MTPSTHLTRQTPAIMHIRGVKRHRGITYRRRKTPSFSPLPPHPAPHPPPRHKRRPPRSPGGSDLSISKTHLGSVQTDQPFAGFHLITHQCRQLARRSAASRNERPAAVRRWRRTRPTRTAASAQRMLSPPLASGTASTSRSWRSSMSRTHAAAMRSASALQVPWPADAGTRLKVHWPAPVRRSGDIPGIFRRQRQLGAVDAGLGSYRFAEGRSKACFNVLYLQDSALFHPELF